MHAILTPVGSAGDVNPFVMIGRELCRRGHRVTLVAPDVFGPVAVKAGIEFASVGTAEEYDRVTTNPELWDPRRGLRDVLGEIAIRLRRGCAALEEPYRPRETLVVGHSLSIFARVFEETHHAPATTIHLAPSVFRSDFRQPALPFVPDFSGWPRWVKRTVWWIGDRIALDPLIAPALNAWRAELGLPPVSRVFKSWFHSPQRVIGLFPDWFAEPQSDWPPQLRVTGFVLSDQTCQVPDAGADDMLLEQFLLGGDSPVVFTPGSANRHATDFFRSAVDAIRSLGCRGLIVTPYRDHLPPSLPASIHHAGYASFATLFPRVRAVVHHGGVGTCAQALAAGVPQVVMPMGFDQPDNASRLARLKVGETIPPRRFTGGRVAAALERLLGGTEVVAACADCRDRIAATNATRSACDLIEEHFDRFNGLA